MSIKKILFALLFSAMSMTGFAQTVSTGYSNFLPPSPSAGATGASGGGLAHGMSGVSIPLANFATNQLSVPVSLSYYSTGTKVDQLASNVGLGWSLHAGGVITRTVRDDRDEVSDPLANYPDSFDELKGDTLTYVAMAVDPTKNVDTEPDLFSFSFMGYSGSFIIDHDGIYRVMPYQNLKIESNDSLDYFNITTPDGILYMFGDSSGGEEATESTRSWRSGQHCQSATTAQEFIRSAWHLKKIVHPVNGEINFDYQTSNTYIYDAGETQTFYELIGNTSPYTCQTYDADYCTIKVEVKERVLTKISATDFGSIEFNSSQRPNVGSMKLDQIIVKAANAQVLKKINLDYQYSANDRMFLSQVAETDANDTQESVSVIDYYDINKVPQRLSYAQDHWGYYNGQDSASYFVPNYVPADNGGKAFPSYLVVPKYDPLKDTIGITNSANLFANIGIDKSPDGNYAKKGMLKSIVHPSTMVTTYEYEPNTLADNTETGGLRLAKITNHDPVTGQNDVTNYDYGPITDPSSSSGVQSVTPSFWSYYSEFTNNYDLFDQPCAEFYDCTYAAMQSSPLNVLTNAGGQHITYEFVTVSKGANFENGAVTYQFYLSNDVEAVTAHGEKLNGVPLSNQGWDNGLVKEVQTYKKVGANFVLLQKSVNHYVTDPAHTTTTSAAVIRDTHDTGCTGNETLTCTDDNNDKEYLVFCRTTHTHNYNGPIGECTASGHNNDIKLIATPPCYGHNPGETVVIYYEVSNVDIMEYKIHSYWYYLDQTTHYQYDEDGNNPVTSTMTYHYDKPAHAQLTSVESDASIEGTILTSYTYPQDYGANGETAMDSLISRYMVGIPVEVSKSVGGEMVSASATGFVYDSSLDAVIPDSFYAYEDTGGGFTASTDGTTFSSYTKKGEILTRDNKGQVISQRAENNIVSTAVRGYNQTLVVASITNATATEVQTALPALGVNLNAGTGGLSASDVTTLRSALPNALITTYTYKIGYGVETMTDPNGRTSTYVYDDYGRVIQVKDHDGNIRSVSEYHNKSQITNQ